VSRDDRERTSNSGVDWDRFDPEAYRQHYYAEPHADDDRLARLSAEAFAAWHPPRARVDAVDVGTGANLFPLLAALPKVTSITAYEHSRSNVEWLERTIRSESLSKEWMHFWTVVKAAYPEPLVSGIEPLEVLRAKARIAQGSIFSMPERRFDAASMFFCAESITSRRDEFRKACHGFARSVIPGGLLVAAFLLRSDGYRVADVEFPAFPVTPAEVEDAFAEVAVRPAVRLVGEHEAEIRSGYSGALLLTAIVA
jgi:hypothetical protein